MIVGFWGQEGEGSVEERVLAKSVMFVRMSRQQALEVSGVAEGDIRLKFSVSENCSTD